jgi:hypothetical protein
VLTSIYLLERGSFGAELLRWSIPGGDAEIDILRRRFHKIPIAKGSQVQAVRRQAITARDPENKTPAAVEPPRGSSVLHTVHAERETRTYLLHYDMADHPVVTTVRKILNREGLQEVDSNAQNQIAVLSENLPRSKLQEILDSGESVIVLLVGNIAFGGDALLERITSIQLIDYRERSKPILTALARTLTEVPDGNLPVGFETTPHPLNSTVLPQFAAEMSLLVLSIGGWLVLSGLISLTQSLAGTAPVSILDLVGFVCGLIGIKLSKDFRLRETTNFGFVPALLISTWLATPLYFGFPFVLAEVQSTNAVFNWSMTLSSLFTSESYLGCLLCPGVLLVIVIAITWHRRLGDWLPATVSRRETGDRFQPLALAPATRWRWIGWNLSALILGALSSLGLRAATYAFFLLIKPQP